MVVVEGVEGVEEFLLALLALAEELDIVDDQQIDRAELPLEVGHGALLDGGDEAVHERFATEELHGRCRIAADDLMADGVERLAKADAAVEKQRVVGGAEGVADSDATGVGQAVAGADDEVVERVVGVQLEGRLGGGLAGRGRPAGDGKVHGDKMAGGGQGRLGEGRLAVVLQELGLDGVRAADLQQAAGKVQHGQFVKPGAAVDRIRGTDPGHDRRQDFRCIL